MTKYLYEVVDLGSNRVFFGEREACYTYVATQNGGLTIKPVEVSHIQEIFTVEPGLMTDYAVVANDGLVANCTSEASAVSLAAYLNYTVARHQGNIRPAAEESASQVVQRDRDDATQSVREALDRQVWESATVKIPGY